MGNIHNNNFNKLSLKINKSEYWDFILSKENDPLYIPEGISFNDDNLISYIDINNENCISGNSLYSLSNYKWDGSVNNGLLLENLGFNNIDNGNLLFDKNNISSKELFNLITGDTLEIPSGDTRLKLEMVSGNTGDYEYPISYINDINGDYIHLDGGFYQGFFKSGNNYSVLPNVIEDEICFEFIIKPDLISIPNIKTLNHKYPDNKGIFFYLGVRSENKFWYEYFKNDINNYEISKVNQASIIDDHDYNNLFTSDGYSLHSQNIYEIPTDNKYLLFNRTINGVRASNFNPDIEYHITGTNEENINYYLYANRTITGITASKTNDILNLEKIPYNIINDIIGNSIAFRIKDDGSIGYRTIIKNCTGESGYDVIEEYSNSGVITNNAYTFISVRLVMDTNSSYDNDKRNFKLMFYVNGVLAFVSKKLPSLMLKELSDISTKQESIPYNISIGGGSQGLCDLIGFNTGYSTQYLFPIEKYFGGSMLGSLFKFRIFYGKTDYSKIKNNVIYESGYTFNPKYILPSVDFWISGDTYKRETGDLTSILKANVKLNDPYHPITGYRLSYLINSNDREYINGIFNIEASGGTIEYLHTINETGVTTVKYVIDVLDTFNSNPGTEKIKTIIFDNMIFYGTTNHIPTGSTDVRLLSNKIFSDEAFELTLNTESSDNVFVVAMPLDCYLYKVEDNVMGNVVCLDITNLFIENIFDVEDASGNPIPYRVYAMKNAIPYSSNHALIMTINR